MDFDVGGEPLERERLARDSCANCKKRVRVARYAAIGDQMCERCERFATIMRMKCDCWATLGNEICKMRLRL